MPPGPVFNWLAVAHSAFVILDHALQHRAAQLTRAGVIRSQKRAHGVNEEEPVTEPIPPRPTYVQTSSLHHANEAWVRQLEIVAYPLTSLPGTATEEQFPSTTDTIWASSTSTSAPFEIDSTSTNLPTTPDPVPSTPDSLLPAAGTALFRSDVSPSQQPPIPPLDESPQEVHVSGPHSQRNLQSSKVPSSRIGRLFHYGGLAASLGYGAASEFLRRSTATGNSAESESSSSLMMTEANLTRLVSKLTRMRGAALKVGQFLSIQDTHVLPPELDRVFRRVQDSAHYMPNWQMESVMTSSLGPSWRSFFVDFDPIPFAAASIGQVHRATLTASISPTGRPERVAVKVQFPNIAESVASDLSYIRILLTAGRLLPRGLFLEKTLAVMKEELADECNYTREAACMRSFGSPQRLGGDARFKVPWVWEGSTDRVLVMEHVDGTSVGGDAVHHLPQADRNEIAKRVIDLCLHELFVFREMQTDPNWSNFLWNAKTRQIELVDFGATRSYSASFIDNWLLLLLAAAQKDREGCLRWSLKLGYLTGEESDIMNNAHIESLQLLATPFRKDTPQPFAFGPDSTWAGITADIRERIPIMLRHRLTPPPRETYSLNRKLSGAFLLASRLRATVDCKELWDSAIDSYRFSRDL